MDTDARRKAQQRVDRIALFREELDELDRDQVLLLTPEQRTRLESYYDDLLTTLTRRFGADATASAKRISWGMRMAALLGGTALLAALVLFLHRVWGLLPGWIQVTLLTAVPWSLLLAGEVAFRRRVDLYYVALVSVAASAAYFMALTALGTIFNLVPTEDSLLVWGGVAVLIAYVYGLRLLLGAGLLVLCAYTAALGMSSAGWYWAALFDRSELLLPGAAILYAIPWLAGKRAPGDFNFVYRVCGAGMGLVALLILSLSDRLGPFGLGVRTVAALCQLAGLGLGAAVVFHGIRLGRSGLVNLGAAGFVVFLYARLQAWCWEWMPKYLFFLLISLTALVLAAVFRRLRQRAGERAAP